MSRSVAMVVVAACLAASGGCGRRPAAGVPERFVEFVDRAADLGIAVPFSSGAEAEQNTILESLGGGAGWIDVDRDGRPDLVAPGGGGFDATVDPPRITGRPLAVWRNVAGRRFREVSGAAGLDDDALSSHGVAIGDYDADGFSDLFVTGYGIPQLWHNRGDGTFVAAGPPGGRDDRWSTSAGWADVDADGLIDLYVARYVDWSFANHPRCLQADGRRDVCPPRSFAGLADSLYRNLGDGTFADISREAGLREDGKGLGVLLADVDVDGDVDIYVANDTVDNFLYVNDGRGRFTERGLLAGVAYDDQGVPNGSMGVDLCDYNRDGLPDIWVTNYERETFALYRNEGRGQFLHVSRRHGIGDLGGLFVGFGTACRDFDADGELDIACADGHVIKYPDAAPRQQDALYLAFDGDRFRRLPGRAGSYFARPHEGRGLAVADYDADGDLDVAITHADGPPALLENRFPGATAAVVVELVGRRSNRDAVGARVELAGPVPVTAQVTGGGSYLSHHDRRIHLAAPAAVEPLRLVVHWPAGARQEIEVPAGRRALRIVEPPGPAAR